MSGHDLRSFAKFNYLLRPSKQVERKLIIEALHRLALGNFRFKDYTYVGLGSVYYADFILFHKYLYVDSMVCLEAEPIEKRMTFNKPYGFIDLQMISAAEFIPRMDPTAKYIVWLDYDSVLGNEIVLDIEGFLQTLSPGSVFLVTVEAEPKPPRGEERDFEDVPVSGRTQRLADMFTSQLGKYSPGGVQRADIARNALPGLFSRVIRAAMSDTLRRRGLALTQLFNFRYADGAQMLTLGGIVADAAINERVVESGVGTLDYIVDAETPLPIYVPPLTTREKQWLDQQVRTGAPIDDTDFEMDRDFVDAFRRFYRHYPSYYEAL